MNNKKIKKPITVAQKRLLLDFIKEHGNLNTGKFSIEFTHKTAELLWKNLTEILNSVPNGTSKEWRQWRKTWQDLKKNIKSKAASMTKSRNQTGGGEPPKELTDEEQEIVDMLSPIATEGLQNIQETPVTIDFEDNTNYEEDSLYGNENNNAEKTQYGSTPKTVTYEMNSPFNDDFIEAIHHENQQENVDTVELDHMYNLRFPSRRVPKKINKTTRLQNSIKVTQDLLKSVNYRNDLLERYYECKIKYMEEHTTYRNKKLDLLKNIDQKLFDISNTLTECADSLTKK